MVLDGGDAADRIHKLADSVVLAVLAFAHVFEVVGKILLVLCVALQSGNAALKILDSRPALSPRYGGILDLGGGGFPPPPAAVLQPLFESVEIFHAAPAVPISRHAVPHPNTCGRR